MMGSLALPVAFALLVLCAAVGHAHSPHEDIEVRELGEGHTLDVQGMQALRNTFANVVQRLKNPQSREETMSLEAMLGDGKGEGESAMNEIYKRLKTVRIRTIHDT